MQNGLLKCNHIIQNGHMQNAILDQSYVFALRIVRLCTDLQKRHEYVLSKQLLRSGTSIGANVEEAQKAQTKRDFGHKCSISLKEAYESRYWLRLLRDSGIASATETNPLLDDLHQIICILAKIVKTANDKQN